MRTDRTPFSWLVCCALVLLALSGAANAGRGPALEDLPEWIHLSVVWNTLSDHTAGQLISQERLHELVPDMDRTEGDLAALVAQKALPAEVAQTLRAVLQERYQYVEAHCYNQSTDVAQSDLEAAEAAARWTIEMQLQLLRPPAETGPMAAAPPDRKLQQAVQASLAYELSFIQQCRARPADPLPQPKETTAREDPKKRVAESTAQVESVKRQQALLRDYRQHRLRTDRAMEQIAPYLVRLTLTPPPPSAQTSDLSVPPLFPF